MNREALPMPDKYYGEFMKILTKALTILLSLCLSTLTGCGLIIQPKLMDNDKLKGIPTFDPNDYDCEINYETVDLGDYNIQYKIEIDYNPVIQSQQTEPTQLKYPMFSSQSLSKCKINNQTYPVLFDTGNPRWTVITAAHVRENQLPIYPVKFTSSDGRNWDLGLGVAMIEELEIAELTITNLPAEYRHYHTGYTLIGVKPLELGQDKEVNIPLTIMQKFKYITFDNKKKQMEFSLSSSFQPNDPSSWKSYSLATTDDNRVYIETTLEGVPVRLMIDTGSEGDLLLTKECFGAMAKNQPKLEKAMKRNRTVFAPFEGGNIACQKSLVSKLTFDKHKHRFHTIITTVDDGNLYEILNKNQFDGIIGFAFFDDTIMTLDFEHNKMWVKKMKRSRFEQ